jgi:glycosyltransferase involved in cell wall biosynthesis
MKILIYSPLFYPSIGGIETVISILAHEFVTHGHSVKLVSQVPATDANIFPFEVIRQPSKQTLLKLMHWCDVYFQGCISLKGIWPLLMIRKPWVVTHQTWYCRPDGKLSWQDYLKRYLTDFSTNIAVSSAIAEQVRTLSAIIPNPYQEEIFYEMPDIPRHKELVFLGRLVSDKGVNLLLNALGNLKQLGITPQLTIIGNGVEEANLRQQVKQLDLVTQVDFAGVKAGHELAQLLNAHKILVVPSLWQEPFGIVALEGIACGCVVVGSEGGGLKDAIGGCGVTFPNGNVEALTQILFDFLVNPDQLLTYRTEAKSHLFRHSKTKVAEEYLQVFERVVS